MSDEHPPQEPPFVAPGAGPGDTSGTGASAGGARWAPAAPTSAPAWPPPAYGGPTGRPLHKPGTVPLRPLTLSDFFDGAFSTVRRNPKGTIGVGAVVTAGFMVVPILVSVVLGLAGGLDSALRPDLSSSGMDGSTLTLNGVRFGSAVFSLLANAVVTGLVVPVVTRAAIGEKLAPSAAWAQVRGRLAALIGLALLELLLAVLLAGVVGGIGAGLGYLVGGTTGAVVLGIVFVLLGFLAAVAMHVKWFQLAAPNLVVERRGILAAVARGGRLSGGSFWRILGIVLLTSILTGIIGGIISVPFTLVGTFLGLSLPDPAGTVTLLIASNLATVVSGAIVAPFTATVAVLQYLDQRFRREGFDIDLITHVQRRAS